MRLPTIQVRMRDVRLPPFHDLRNLYFALIDLRQEAQVANDQRSGAVNALWAIRKQLDAPPSKPKPVVSGHDERRRTVAAQRIAAASIVQAQELRRLRMVVEGLHPEHAYRAPAVDAGDGDGATVGSWAEFFADESAPESAGEGVDA